MARELGLSRKDLAFLGGCMWRERCCVLFRKALSPLACFTELLGALVLAAELGDEVVVIQWNSLGGIGHPHPYPYTAPPFPIRTGGTYRAPSKVNSISSQEGGGGRLGLRCYSACSAPEFGPGMQRT